MHQAVINFVSRVWQTWAEGEYEVLEIGNRNVNGSIRECFPDAAIYIGVDKFPGPGVDLICDAELSWPLELSDRFQVVVSTETLEHCIDPKSACINILKALAPGGMAIITCAGVGRMPHSWDGNDVRDGEIYHNITAANLRSWFAGASSILIDDASHVGDLQALVFK